MKKLKYIFFLLLPLMGLAQPSSNSGSYCVGGYSSGQCNQPGASNSAGNFVNDFIDCFMTSGGNQNINNCGSGCNGNPNNYGFYCNYNMVVTPGQVITCSVQSGITYPQGFAVWVDWNQDGVFQANEFMTGTSTVPPAASLTTLPSFTIPANTPPGAYRLRVRCSYITNAANMSPCQNYTYGETEDYTIYVGANAPGILTVSASAVHSICERQTIALNSAPNTTAAVTYTWTGPTNYTASVQNPSIVSSSTLNTGLYTVTISDARGCMAHDTVRVKVFEYPPMDIAVPVMTMCQGGSVIAALNFTVPNGNASNYDYYWFTGPGASGIVSPTNQITQIIPTPLQYGVDSVSLNYSVTVIPKIYGCAVVRSMTLRIYNPPTPTLTIPPPLCNTAPSQILVAAPNTGTWTNNVAVSSAGVLSPGLAAIGTYSVLYTIAYNACVNSNIGWISVAQFNTSALASNLRLVCEKDAPINLMGLPFNASGTWTGPGVTTTNGYTYSFTPTSLPTGNYNLTYSIASSPAQFATVCPSTTVMTVFVYNPAIPVFTPVPQLCSTGTIVTAQASPTLNGIWSMNSGVSQNGIITPSLCGIGNNTVLYTSGTGTCVSSATFSFSVNRFNPATLTGSVPPLCVSSLPVTLMSFVQNANGNWKGAGVTANVFNPSGLATNTYSLVYTTTSTPNPLVCPDSRTLAISVLNPQVPTITKAGPFCSIDGPYQMSVTPSGGAWVTTTYLDKKGIFSPSLASVGSNAIQYVVGTSTCNQQQTIYVDVDNFVPATIVSKIPDVCMNASPVNLQPFALASSGTWGGIGVSNGVFNPASTGAGNFILTYTTASIPNGLCPDMSTVALQVIKVTTPTITPVGRQCSNAAPFSLNVVPIGGRFGSPNSAVISPNGLFVPSSALIGSNLITYSYSSMGCISYAQTTIDVVRFVSAAFSETIASVCQNDPVLNLNSFAVNPGFDWSPNNLVTFNGLFDPYKKNAGVYPIVYTTHALVDNLLCVDQNTLNITVIEVPAVKIFTNSVLRGCVPFPVMLRSSDNRGTAEWVMGDNTPNENGISIGHTYNLPGTYTVVMNYKINGCKTQATLDTCITVLEAPTADFEFSANPVLNSSPGVAIYNTSKPAGKLKFTWDIDSFPNVTEINPEITLPRLGKYKVKLTAATVAGCVDDVTKVVELINDFNVYIPNAFTPNFDDLNDVFIPKFSDYGLDGTRYEFVIYNRWGEMVFRSFEPKKGWNGLTHKNEVCKEGIYNYTLQFRDLDGNSYFRTGTVMLFAGQTR